MNKVIDIHKVAGILLQNRTFLVTRSKRKNFFISPGGKAESGESLFQTLKRELKEEVDVEVDESDVQPFGTFYAQAQGQEDKYIQMDVFLVSKWSGDITPTSEVEEVKWIDSHSAHSIELGSIFKHDVLPKLLEMKLID